MHTYANTNGMPVNAYLQFSRAEKPWSVAFADVYGVHIPTGPF